MIEESVEEFMDDFSIFGNSFKTCLNNLDKMHQHFKNAHLVLNKEKCHFMVKEGIVLGPKVSSAELEVNKAKIDVTSKFPPPANIKALRHLFKKQDAKPRLIRWILLLQEFDIEIKDKKGIENIAADHLSQIKNDELSNDSEVDDNFSEETLMEIITKDESWFADFANYLVGDIIPKGMSYQQKNKFLSNLKPYFWEEPDLCKVCSDALRHLFKKQDAKPRLIRWILLLQEFDIEIKDKKGIENIAADHLSQIKNDELSNDSEVDDNFSEETLMEIITKDESWFADFANYLVGDIIPKGMSYQQKNKFLSNLKPYFWEEPDLCKVCSDVITFLKKLFCHFRMPEALISDRGTYFCNKIMERTMKRYGVNHHFSTSYHPQTSGQVENTNRALKRILEKTITDNPAIWSRKLDDALWAFFTAYKTPTGTTPYKLIYGKNCHLPFEIEHRAYWALKNCNPDLIAAGEKRMFQLHELDELRHQAYKNSCLYKERTKV
nr:hypothetical protein [Tanacetum cinerariifolium]